MPIGFGAKQGPVICRISQDRFRESPKLRLPKIVKDPIAPSKTARPKNALAHGLYASDLVLAWENEQDFVDLHESIRQELSADVEALSKLGESLESFGGRIADLLRDAANFDLEQGFFERAYRPDVVERTAKVEVQIDKQIEKAIARLANLKEFKRIYTLL